MSQRHPKVEHIRIGRAGWFAIGVLAASVAFILILVVGDLLKAPDNSRGAKAETPAHVIEGQ
jgi:hypothetical protein